MGGEGAEGTIDEVGGRDVASEKVREGPKERLLDTLEGETAEFPIFPFDKLKISD